MTQKLVQSLNVTSSPWTHLRLRPRLNYVLILSIVVLLTCIGVLMVTSSSMTWAVLEGSSVFATAIRQIVMVGVGFVALWMCLRTRPTTIRRMAPIVLGLSIVLLVLVLSDQFGTGREEVGSQSWLVFGPLRLQPSELAKLAIAVWGSSFLADPLPAEQKKRRSGVFILVAALVFALILLEHDLGMAITFLVVAAMTLVFAGYSLKPIISAGVVLFITSVAYLMNSSGFRGARLAVYKNTFFGHFEDIRGRAYQSYQGFLSLADGGLFGVGLGQSRARWFYLPEAKNDFIFAIVGEETGVVGAVAVILLYGLLCYFGLRSARTLQNSFLALLAATMTTSVAVQAFTNIGYVVGLLPVTGIQLPMLSAGGTSAVITLAAMGLLANCARHEPESVSSIQNQGLFKLEQFLFIPEPQPVPATIGMTPESRPQRTPSGGRPTNPDRDDSEYPWSRRSFGPVMRQRAQAASEERRTSERSPYARRDSVASPARRRHTSTVRYSATRYDSYRGRPGSRGDRG